MALRRRTQEALYYVIVGVLILLILFSNFRVVGGSYVSEYDPKYCNGKGRINSTVPDGMCTCFGDYYGAQCTLRYCPRGISWTPDPTGNHDGNRKYVECSNMGICDPYSGVCACRDAYEGRACERLACPRPTVQMTGIQSLKDYMKTVYTSGIGVFARSDGLVIPETYTNLPFYESRPCSGHGICMTMREASTTFNGRNLVLPSVDYNEWDADKIQGCVCDDGWTGAACSERQCLFGIDPLSTEDNDIEEYTLQCQADEGYFSLFILGMYTEPIPYDADPGYLKYAIERIPGVTSGSVLVSMPKNTGGLPTVCSSSTVSTSIKFTDRYGPRPPIKVYEPTSNTRMWPSGASALLLGGGIPILQMKTTYTLYCPACTSCSGYVSFAFGDSITDAYDVTSSSLFSTIESDIKALNDLSNAEWSNLTVSVSGSTQICDTSAKTTTISLTSDYGNIPELKVVYKVYADTTTAKTLTWSSTNGGGTLYECSNQGLCNRQNGVCQCVQDAYDNTMFYRASSSDGANDQGTRADCGYIETYPSSCYVAGQNICNGNGYCSNSTNLCTCYDGYFGLTCAVKECPTGYAWFDEATTSVDAHALTECSNMGTCDRSTGTCTCRNGFTGSACEVHDCPRDSDGSACSGHGWCMSSEHVAYAKGFSYGSSPGHHTNRRAYPGEWDARQLYNCICSTQMGSNYGGHSRYPSVGPSGYISGIAAGGSPLPGWTGYDCSLRRCPSGDNVNYRNYYGGVFEVQRVLCTEAASSSIYFKLRINGHLSDYIYGNYDLESIESAIEWAKTVGNATISFPNSDTDSIVTACSPSHTSGFLVQFDTELGDIPQVSVEYGSLSSLNVAITETTKGTKSNLECGGPEMGYCDRDSGLCMCHSRQESSDGDNNAGSRGDCGYYNKYKVVNGTRTITTITGEAVTISSYKNYP